MYHSGWDNIYLKISFLFILNHGKLLIDRSESLIGRIKVKMKMQIEMIPEAELVYIRRVGPYGMENIQTMEKL